MDYEEGKVLGEYLFWYGYGVDCFSEAENAARAVIFTRKKASTFKSSSRKIELLKRIKDQENRSDVQELLAKGELAFIQKLSYRINQEHPEVVARCPKCTKVLRTPRARQCRWCLHDWHET